MLRALRVQYPGAVYHVMDRGDWQERIFLDDVDRQDWLKTLAEACAERLRRETTLSVKWIAGRLQLGTPKSARALLHQRMRRPQAPTTPELCAQLQFQPIV
jgi:hypothetical protein